MNRTDKYYLFKVGDKVKIRENLANGGTYSSVKLPTIQDDVVGAMYDMRGMIVHITELDGGKYHINEDGHKWYWIDSMFEPVPKTPRYVE